VAEKTEFYVRGTVSADRPAIISIIEKSENLTDEEKACAMELLERYLEEVDKDGYIFLTAASADDAPVGYVCYGLASLSMGAYDIYWILVDPGFHGKGAGSSLLGRAEALIKERGGRIMLAETSGLPSYGKTRSFYLKCGLHEEARIRDFFKPGDDKIIYMKNLS